MKLTKLGALSAEKGQAAVFITILLMLALIALAALAIDGGHLYVVRRDLQNMADAACLAAATELALGGEEDAAIAIAREYVIENGGEFFSVWPEERPNEGSGTGLTWGIEVAGAEIRVALQTVVETYFTMIFDRHGAGVGARAHCNSQAGGGLLPIAVRRYEYVEGDEEQQLDIVANKNCEPPDCYYPSSCDTEYLDGYYGDNTPFCRVTNDEWIPITGTLHYTWTGNIDCDLPPADEELDGVCVLGVYPETNDGTAKYSGFVSLDIRNIVGGCPPNRPESECGIQYYNGASGQDATNKLLAGEWFCNRGWEGWRVPELGDQLAFLPGVSARFSPKTMIDCGWDVGDPFVAVVYSGYVWDIPDLEMSIDPAVNFIRDLEQDEPYTVVYTGTLKKPPESKPWEADANFELQAFFWEDDEPSSPITPTIDVPPPVTLLQGWSEVTFPITVSVTGPSTTTTYLSALTVQARELGLGLKRWASANLSYGGVANNFTIYPGGLEFNGVQGDFLNIPLTTSGFGFSQKKAPVLGSINGRPWGDAFASDPWGTVEIKDGADSRNERFTLEVAQDAVPGRYTVQLTVRPGDPPWHSVEFDVVVSEPLEGGIPTRFVIVEGFAPFEISYIDQNDVVAFAIGPIVPDLSQVTAGTRGALLPW